MKIGMLLEKLIDVAKKPKTDFALSMNMTPSGLSKILTGKRVPLMKERKAFTRQAAHYFAEAIYSPGCYLKFANLFPVIYDFESQEELQTFLSSAIAFALDNSFSEENSLNLSFTDRGLYYLGRKPVLNQLCIILSDQLVSCPCEPAELFASLPLRDPVYFKIFHRLVFLEYKKPENIVLNYYFGDDFINGPNGIEATDFLHFISTLQKHADLNFYQSNHDSGHFLLWKGQFLLLFNTQIDGAPLLVPICHKSYLNVFYNVLMRKGSTKASYSTGEAIAFLESNPQIITALQSRKVDGVYNFMSIGYLLNKQELEATQSSPLVCDFISKLFTRVLSTQTTFVVSMAAMDRFSSLGRAIVPLIGAIPFPPELRVDYLRRFDAYLSESNYDKLKIVDSGFSNIAVLVSQGLCLIYTLDDTFQREKTHVFHSPRLGSLIDKELCASDRVIADFTKDLWNAYQEELLNTGLDHNR